MRSALLAITAVTALAVPSLAAASTVSVEPDAGHAVFRTGPGEASDVVVTDWFPDVVQPPFTIAFSDSAGSLSAGDGCTAGTPVLCWPATVAELRLGPLADTASAILASSDVEAYGGGGADDIRAAGQSVDVTAGPGDDTVVANANNTATVSGNGGDDAIAARESGGDLRGGRNDDLLVGAALINSLDGGDGRDTLIGSSRAGGSMDGGDGRDLIAFAPANRGGWRIAAGDGQDHVYASGAGDDIDAGAGFDRVSAFNGIADTVDCGSGFDVAYTDPEDTVSRCEIVLQSDPGALDPDVATALARAAELLAR